MFASMTACGNDFHKRITQAFFLLIGLVNWISTAETYVHIKNIIADTWILSLNTFLDWKFSQTLIKSHNMMSFP